MVLARAENQNCFVCERINTSKDLWYWGGGARGLMPGRTRRARRDTKMRNRWKEEAMKKPRQRRGSAPHISDPRTGTNGLNFVFCNSLVVSADETRSPAPLAAQLRSISRGG